MAEKQLGRPLIYDSSFHPQEAQRLAAEGMIDAEIARNMGIGVSTLNDWKKKYPIFLESIKAGKAIVDQKVVGSLFQRACGFYVTETKTIDDGHSVRIETTKKWVGDTTAQIYWTKNRMPEEFRDKVQSEISGPEGAPLTLNLIRTDFKKKSDE
jgi:hypothetical protein